MASMSAQQLIEHLESRGLLPADLIRELRDSVAKTPDVSPRQLVRWLVSNGHLSRYQADNLLPERSEPPKPWVPPTSPEEPRGRRRSKARGAEKAGPDVDDLEVIDDLEEIAPGDLTPLPPMTPGPPSLDALMQAANMPASNLGPAMGPGGMLGMPGMGKKQKPPANPWDNKLILIGGGSLVLLIFIGVVLAFSLNRRTGDEAFQAAEEA